MVQPLTVFFSPLSFVAYLHQMVQHVLGGAHDENRGFHGEEIVLVVRFAFC
jgi:hypothetical protein